MVVEAGGRTDRGRTRQMSKTKQPGPIQIGCHVYSAGGMFTAI